MTRPAGAPPEKTRVIYGGRRLSTHRGRRTQPASLSPLTRPTAASGCRGRVARLARRPPSGTTRSLQLKPKVCRGVAGCGAKLAPTAGEKSQRTRPARNYCDNPALGVDPPSPRTSAPPSGLAGPESASGDPQTRPKRPCGGRTGRRVGARCTARPDLPAKTPPVGRSGLAVHVGPRGAAPRAAAPSRDALLGVFTLEKALSKITGGGGGRGRARPWVI